MLRWEKNTKDIQIRLETTFSKSISQLVICRIFLHLDWSDVSSRLDLSYSFGVRIVWKQWYVLSVYQIGQYMMSVYLITGNVKFSHQMRWYLIGFSTVKLFFHFVIKIILWGNTSRLYKCPVYHHTLAHSF